MLALACVNFTHIMDSMIMMPLGDIFMREFNVGPKEFTFLVSAYAIGAFLSNVAGIFTLDKFDRKNALLVIYGGFIAGTFCCALCNTYESLLVVRFITGLFGGLNGSLVFAIVADLFAYSKRGRAMGAIMAGFSAAAALGVPLGLLVSFKMSWHYAFYFIAAFSLLVYLAILFAFPPVRAHLNYNASSGAVRLTKFQRLLNITKDMNQVNALIFGVLLVFGHMVIIPFIAPFMERNVGFTQTQLIYLYLIGGTLTVFTSPLFGRFTDAVGGNRSYVSLLLLSLIPVVWITHMKTPSVGWALFATSLLFVFGSGRMIAPQAMISAVVTSQTRGSFMSFKAALQQLAIGLSAIVSGYIVTEAPDGKFTHYNIVGYLSVAVLLLTFAYVGRLKVVKGNE